MFSPQNCRKIEIIQNKATQKIVDYFSDILLPIIPVFMVYFFSTKQGLFGEFVSVDGPFYTTLMKYGSTFYNYFSPDYFYQWTRVSVTFPGWLFNQFLDIENSYLLYRFLLLYLMSASLNSMLKRLSTPSIRIVSIFFILSNPLVLTTISNEYHFFAILPLFVTLICIYIKIIVDLNYKLLFIAGIISTMLLTSSASVPVVGVTVLCYFLVNLATNSKHNVLKQIIYFFFGSLIAVLLYLVESFIMLKRVDIFQKTFFWTKQIASSGYMNYWRTDNLIWLNSTTTLLTLLIVLFALILSINVKKMNSKNNLLIMTYVSYPLVTGIGIFLWYCYSQFFWKNGMGLFQMSQHVSILLAPFLLIFCIVFVVKVRFIKRYSPLLFLFFVIMTYFSLIRLDIATKNIYPELIFYLALITFIYLIFRNIQYFVTKLNIDLILLVSFWYLIVFSTLSQTTGPIVGAANIKNPNFKSINSNEINYKQRYVDSENIASWVFTNLDKGTTMTWLSEGNAWVEGNFIFDAASRFFYWNKYFTITNSPKSILSNDDLNKVKMNEIRNLIIFSDNYLNLSKMTRNAMQNVPFLKQKKCKYFEFEESKAWVCLLQN